MAQTKIPSGTAEYDILASNRTYLLDTHALLNVSGSNGIFAGSSVHDDTIIIKGDIKQAGNGFAGIWIGGDDMTIRIEAGGSIAGKAGIVSDGVETSSKFDIFNNGLINAGNGYAIQTLDSKEFVVNHGIIHGRIDLGSGADIFDNRGGALDHGVAGGTGDDTLFVDKANTKLIEDGGSAGYDTVKSTVSYTLSENVERLILLGNNNTNGFGTADGDDLFGNAGNNKLFAKAGVDSLDGGKGNDQLTGGFGADTFVFKSGNDHDTITDFENGIDKVDLSHWSAISSFSDLKNHHLSFAHGDAIISAGGDQLVIENMTKGEVDSGDFSFL